MVQVAEAVGSAGAVHTQYADLPRPLALDCGRYLYPVRMAYETYGTLAPARDNIIMVCHALSGDAHAAGWSVEGAPSASDGFGAEERGSDRSGLGWWDNLIGPGKALDTEQIKQLPLGADHVGHGDHGEVQRIRTPGCRVDR